MDSEEREWAENKKIREHSLSVRCQMDRLGAKPEKQHIWVFAFEVNKWKTGEMET